MEIQRTQASRVLEARLKEPSYKEELSWLSSSGDVLGQIRRLQPQCKFGHYPEPSVSFVLRT